MAARTNKRDPCATQTLRHISFAHEVKQSFLIICEGVNTGLDYFSALRLTSANIRAVNQGLNTVGLVQEALRMKEEERRKGCEYDQYWVVFDKDDSPDRDFNRAISMTEAGGTKVTYSNQTFEYWFLLHYNLTQGPMHRNQYETKLFSLLGFSYNKEAGINGRVFKGLGGKQAQAITNTKAVLRRIEGIPPTQTESSTTVHLLVGELNRYIWHVLSFARIILYPATTSFWFYRILCHGNTKTDGKS